MTLGTINVGIDRSPIAADALRWAWDLARATGAGVRAITTWRMPLITALQGAIDALPTPEFMERRSSAVLDEVVGALDDDSIRRVVIEGAPGPALAAESSPTDLLVVGRTGQGKRHGISRLAEIALGSTARYCIHHAYGPVATVPEGASWSEPATVVVGIDGSSSSLEALHWALTALPASADIHVVRAVTSWIGDRGVPGTPGDADEDGRIDESTRLETQTWVDETVASVERNVAAPTVEVVVGSARDVVADPGYDVDLIVVGARGHTGVAARVLGSISDHLVRYATCPVIVVPDYVEQLF